MNETLADIDRALAPYERRLKRQERLRRFLGVREVDRPTYERYITGPVERFDRRKNGFMTLRPDDPYGAEFRERLRAKLGTDTFSAPPDLSTLDAPGRIGQSLANAAIRACVEYEPSPLPVTPEAAGVRGIDKAWMTRLVKKAALLFGAELVRITRLDPRWVYQDVDIRHEYAIVLVVTHIPSLLLTAPSNLAEAATGEVYSRLKVMSVQLADFIRSMGFDATQRETSGYNPELLMVPLAVDAGVGEYSRVTRVLSPEFGTNMRLRAVTTDMPLDVDRPISFGVHDCCTVCEECARQCPPRAIPFGPATGGPISFHNNPGYCKWTVDAEKCLTYTIGNKTKWSNCARCLHYCPWNKPLTAPHNLVRWAVIHAPIGVKRTILRAGASR